MRDRILTILSALRRRMLAVRAAEAAAVGGVAGGLACAFAMAGWIIAPRHGLAAAAVSAVPLLAGAALLGSRRARARLGLRSPLQWYAAASPAAVGAAAATCILTGAFDWLAKNWLVVLVPGGALLAAALALLRGTALGSVAADVDRRGGLRERLSTAWELARAGEEDAFAQAVRRQAVDAADRRDLARLSFWSRTPATLGALGLAVAAAALMLPWEPLKPPGAALRQRWRQVSAQAGRLLQQPLETLDAKAIAGSANVAALVGQLRELTERLRADVPADATRWRGQLVELRELTAALRQAVSTARLDARASQQIHQLIRTLDQVAAEIAEGMGESAPQYALSGEGEPPGQPPRRPTATAPAGYATVYHPRYADLAPPTSTDSAPATPPDEGPAFAPAVPQVSYDQAWAAARRRASQALSGREIPGEYRQLVRDFFAPDR